MWNISLHESASRVSAQADLDATDRDRFGDLFARSSRIDGSPLGSSMCPSAESLLNQTQECDQILYRLGEITDHLTTNLIPENVNSPERIASSKLSSSFHPIFSPCSIHLNESQLPQFDDKFDILTHSPIHQTAPFSTIDVADHEWSRNATTSSRGDDKSPDAQLIETVKWVRTVSLDIHVELEELQRHITYLKTELGSCKALLLSIESAIASKTSTAVRVVGGLVPHLRPCTP